VRQKLATSLATTVPVQIALADYLKQGGYDKHLRRLRQTLARQEAALVEAVERHFPPSTRLTRPSGGYFLWLELPAGVDALALHHRRWNRGSASRPGRSFRPSASSKAVSGSTSATRIRIGRRLWSRRRGVWWRGTRDH
jgi:DNA-binding transcriptional MocR family regulator